MVSHASSTLEQVVDPAALRRAFGCFPSGVAAVCALTPQGAVGLLVSSFTSVSLDPPLVSICLMKGSRRWSLLRGAPRLGLSFLSDAQRQVCEQLSAPLEQGLGELATSATPDGAVLLCEATAWLDCSLHEEVDAGDHTIALLRIEALHARPGQSPLVFHNSGFHRLTAL